MGTEIFSHLNWLAILVAGLAYFFIGAIWYSFLFKKPWIRLSGVNVNDPNAKKGMGAMLLGSLLLTILCSLGLALFLAKIGGGSWMSGAKIGLVAGVCFSATALCNSYLFEKRPLGLHFINAGYAIAGSVVAGVILSVWR